ncbi:hypothetical protein RCL_jg4750.t1 [Rhizophagus clarus]|uniref:Uncharacterized protein n=1 Tax=Rhizophagus clarus TaxID=94130 RepID=A0A8H3MJ39_9GLOM|nr:hypothetical protein RCL_jg4750.t1 [Rhizophagus clarus]
MENTSRCPREEIKFQIGLFDNHQEKEVVTQVFSKKNKKEGEKEKKDWKKSAHHHKEDQKFYFVYIIHQAVSIISGEFSQWMFPGLIPFVSTSIVIS